MLAWVYTLQHFIFYTRSKLQYSVQEINGFNLKPINNNNINASWNYNDMQTTYNGAPENESNLIMFSLNILLTISHDSSDTVTVREKTRGTFNFKKG